MFHLSNISSVQLNMEKAMILANRFYNKAIKAHNEHNMSCAKADYSKACDYYRQIVQFFNKVERPSSTIISYGISARLGVIICEINFLSNIAPTDAIEFDYYYKKLASITNILNQLVMETHRIGKHIALKIKSAQGLYDVHKQVIDYHKKWAIDKMNYRYLANLHDNYAQSLNEQKQYSQAIKHFIHAANYYVGIGCNDRGNQILNKKIPALYRSIQSLSEASPRSNSHPQHFLTQTQKRIQTISNKPNPKRAKQIHLYPIATHSLALQKLKQKKEEQKKVLINGLENMQTALLPTISPLFMSKLFFHLSKMFSIHINNKETPSSIKSHLQRTQMKWLSTAQSIIDYYQDQLHDCSSFYQKYRKDLTHLQEELSPYYDNHPRMILDINQLKTKGFGLNSISVSFLLHAATDYLIEIEHIRLNPKISSKYKENYGAPYLRDLIKKGYVTLGAEQIESIIQAEHSKDHLKKAAELANAILIDSLEYKTCPQNSRFYIELFKLIKQSTHWIGATTTAATSSLFSQTRSFSPTSQIQVEIMMEYYIQSLLLTVKGLNPFFLLSEIAYKISEIIFDIIPIITQHKRSWSKNIAAPKPIATISSPSHTMRSLAL